jgi:hypothetical protein
MRERSWREKENGTRVYREKHKEKREDIEKGKRGKQKGKK